MDVVSKPQNIEYTFYRGKRIENFDKLTLGEAIDKFVLRREESCSTSTLARYDQYKRVYFCDMLDIPIIEIDSDLLQDKVNHLKKKSLHQKQSRTHTIIFILYWMNFYRTVFGKLIFPM